MKFRLFQTNFGYSAVLFEDDLTKRVFLPATKEAILKSLKHFAPDAVKATNGVEDVVEFLVQFSKGEDVTISMKRMDTTLCSPFQLSVLEAERGIPRGNAVSYSWVARKIGTNAVRVVGTALATNPFPFVVPCHRSLRMDRTIGMYQGGPEMKRQLLEMEGVRFDDKGRVVPDCFIP
ncbi:MAG: methylated-DNA--[protein]-cysteine S-methyltransferase [Candidatus Thorarchaeota archaeon]|jgi:methylated-DNA-[protein]-cysteine S-methyltransferase